MWRVQYSPPYARYLEMSENRLDRRALESIPGIGPQTLKRLDRLGIHTLQDILFHLPLRYEDRTRITPVSQLQINIPALVEGTILHNKIEYGNRRSLSCLVEDDTAAIILRFYRFHENQRRRLAPGTRVRCYATPRQGSRGMELYHPEYHLIKAAPPPLEKNLTPVYPSIAGIAQTLLRRISHKALHHLQADALHDWLAADLHTDKPSLKEALCHLHAPPAQSSAALREKFRRHLVFEELLAHQLGKKKLRNTIRQYPAPSLPEAPALQQKLLDILGFPLTDAQQRVRREIAQDLNRSVPMLRLLQGDVGSGKTVVAALATLQAHAAACQSVLMVPTEILATQHHLNFARWCAALGMKTALLTGAVKGKKRSAVLQQLQAGDISVIIGTHALLQTDVHFARLGLVIIDEQHRFGVHQRLSLKKKSRETPHQLIMTATPIPRTLAMTACAHLDYSVIDTMPHGRKPITTALLSMVRRDELITRLGRACSQGQQAYWVCPLIEESDILQCRGAEAAAAKLQKQLPHLKVGLVHGRLKSVQKAEMMAAFNAGEIQLLVATTVIEVGVDIANASLMVIENPERLGLAQLHQLRGRIGRGTRESACVLLHADDLGNTSRIRLAIIRDHNDGFTIAEQDWQLRGSGELFGAQQAGNTEFRIADLHQHKEMLEEVRCCAEKLWVQEPHCVAPLIERWFGTRRHYAEA